MGLFSSQTADTRWRLNLENDGTAYRMVESVLPAVRNRPVSGEASQGGARELPYPRACNDATGRNPHEG